MYILSAPNLTPSARLLAQRLEEVAEAEPFEVVTSLPRNELSIKLGNFIRWGNSATPGQKETIYNSPELIRTAGNKMRFSEAMEQAKIPHTNLYTGTPERFPVLVRTELNRGGGIGLFIAETPDQFAQWQKYPWSYFYNFSIEVGVHMLGGEVVKIFKKVREEGLEQEKYPRRNTNNGYRFSLIRNDKFPKLLKFCEQFYKVFPIQMGRADIGWDVDARTWRIIEFNSAPDLTQNHNTLEMYAQFLAERI
jgi:hypothetical protein